MNSDGDKTCPDCKGTMTQVRLLDRMPGAERDVEYNLLSTVAAYKLRQLPLSSSAACCN